MQNRDLEQKIKRLEEDKGEKLIPREESDRLKSKLELDHAEKLESSEKFKHWRNKLETLGDKAKNRLIALNKFNETDRGKKAWQEIKDYDRLLADHENLQKEVNQLAEYIERVVSNQDLSLEEDLHRGCAILQQLD